MTDADLESLAQNTSKHWLESVEMWAPEYSHCVAIHAKTTASFLASLRAARDTRAPKPLLVSGEIPTPRTDSEAKTFGDAMNYRPQEWLEVVTSKFARQLERELIEAQRYGAYKDETATTFINQVKKLQVELATEREAREKFEQLAMTGRLDANTFRARAESAEAKLKELAEALEACLNRIESDIDGKVWEATDASEVLARYGAKGALPS